MLVIAFFVLYFYFVYGRFSWYPVPNVLLGLVPADKTTDRQFANYNKSPRIGDIIAYKESLLANVLVAKITSFDDGWYNAEIVDYNNRTSTKKIKAEWIKAVD